MNIEANEAESHCKHHDQENRSNNECGKKLDVDTYAAAKGDVCRLLCTVIIPVVVGIVGLWEYGCWDTV